MSELFVSIFGSVIRKLLAGVGAWFVTQGWVSSGNWEELLGGAVMFLASVAWGVYGKYARPYVNQLPR